jgi:hypothetical protein
MQADMQNPANEVTSNLVKLNDADRSLKGLLMDKGREGLEDKLQQFLQKIILVQGMMESLVEQQRISADAAGCDCLVLYLATNYKTGRNSATSKKIKTLDVLDVQLHHTKGAAVLEWRAGKSFGLENGLAGMMSRVHAFNSEHEHYVWVREYVKKTSPNYYEVLVGFDVIKVSLNHAIRNLRRTLIELNALLDESRYPQEVFRGAEKMSRRIFKGLPDSERVAQVLNQLYAI